MKLRELNFGNFPHRNQPKFNLSNFGVLNFENFNVSNFGNFNVENFRNFRKKKLGDLQNRCYDWAKACYTVLS
jgi:hypothetical protein